jgi:predicted AlkP superfamily pyrophosphatase or phosphodiesterase
MIRRYIFAFLVSVVYVSLASAAESPRLIVFIVVDQMRADQLERYSREYSGGFKRLLTEGLVFSNADLSYALTATAPGHATLFTGTYPWKNGVVGNSFFDRDANRRVYSVQDSSVMAVDGEGGMMSPRNLMATTIGDWLKTASPRSKVISISIKDRPAIFMGGKKADYSFWYDPRTGHMVTSSYYATTIPSWVKSFNAADWIERNLPAAWQRLKADSVYERFGSDDIKGEFLWGGCTTFPHPFQPDRKKSQLTDSPFGNTLLLDFAGEALHREKLGQRDVPDLLCISLSATDLVGTLFGPDSHEMIDNLLRLDHDLGDFFALLTSTVGRDQVLVVLASDHGVMPLPEYRTNVEHQFARRIDGMRLVRQKLVHLDSLLRDELKVKELIVGDGYLNYQVAEKAGIDPPELERRVRKALMTIEGAEDVMFRTELLDSRTPERPYLEAYRRSSYTSRGPDFFVRPCEYCLVTESMVGTLHGSPYAYDTRIPLVFWSQNLEAGKVERAIRAVDIAPTLAKLLHLTPPNDIDGELMKEVDTR